uniref:G protein-coupled receptor 26 n=1 Tax=Eptatretus burgeri TaxID=7764 RepID=A0A8C4N7Y4_EPTBU
MDVGDILLSLFAVVVLTASFLSNLIVVICYVYSSEIRRHVPSVFTINLTLCNLVMTLFNMPITLAGIIVPGEFMLGERLCFAHGFMETFLMSNVMLSMAALSLDRWIAVVFPLSYNTKMSYKDATAIMLYSWLHSLTFPVVAVCLKWFDYSPGYASVHSTVARRPRPHTILRAHGGVPCHDLSAVAHRPLPHVHESTESRSLPLQEDRHNHHADARPAGRHTPKSVRSHSFLQEIKTTVHHNLRPPPIHTPDLFNPK